jgi:double-strand break repair protein MRE11
VEKAHGANQYFPEYILPEFLDLILWGHGTDCRIQPEQSATKQFYMTQPGSSVATSLSEGETVEKRNGILEMFENQFKITALQLKTVRPFVFR